MERQKSEAIRRAEERFAEAKEVVRILKFVEKSRKEYPNPKIIVKINKLWDRPDQTKAMSADLIEERKQTDDLIIRALSSSKNPISPVTLGEVFGLIEGLEESTMRVEILNLREKSVIQLDEHFNLKLAKGITLK